MSFSKFRVDPQPVLLFNNGPEDGSSSSPNPYPHPGPPPDHRRFSVHQAILCREFIEDYSTACPCIVSAFWRVNKWYLHWGKPRIIDKNPYFYFKDYIERVERWELNVLQPLSFETSLRTFKGSKPAFIISLSAKSVLRLNVSNLPPQRFCNLWRPPTGIGSRPYLLKNLHGVLQDSAEMEGQIQGKQLKLCVRRRDRAFEPIFKQHSWTQALDKWQEMYNDAIVVIVESEAEATLSVDVNSEIKEISSLISTLASSSATASFQTHNSSSSTLVRRSLVPNFDSGKFHNKISESKPIAQYFGGPEFDESGLKNKTLVIYYFITEQHFFQCPGDLELKEGKRLGYIASLLNINLVPLLFALVLQLPGNGANPDEML
ncbi:hypothetical protein C8J56DRAFT_883523 [Mycena floridula]|nr:hypothetical protein C8J56DRAFT_883523 [Mycena floridula]